MRNLVRVIVAVAVLMAIAPAAHAQDGPEKGGHEVQLWTGGGTSRDGGVRGISTWNLGFRYGWILTGAVGPSVLKGRLEYALDTAPIFWFFEPGGTAYGAAISPVVLKWNFEQRGRFVPYVEANAGFSFHTRQVPPGAWNGNFNSSGAIGTHILGEKGNLSVEVRLMHTSNANLTNYNPGVNTLQVRIGLGRFLRSN